MIKANMTDAVKVKFLKQIFEEDFPEKGMIAWLTDIEWDSGYDCYNLFFDFREFEEHNDKYFKEVYWPNIHTKKLEAETGRKLFTAKEAGCYNPKYSVYFSISTFNKDDALFEQENQRLSDGDRMTTIALWYLIHVGYQQRHVTYSPPMSDFAACEVVRKSLPTYAIDGARCIEIKTVVINK